MIIEATATGKTVDEAKENAIAELNAGNDADVQFETIDLPQTKVLGIFGGKPAKVRAFYEAPDAVKTTEKPVATKTAAPAAKPQSTNTANTEEVKPAIEGTPMDENDPIIKNVVEYLKNVLTLMGIENLKFSITKAEDTIMIDFDGNRLGTAIGRKGETLDALQHLCALVANKEKEDYFRITLNPGGYRQKREETLIAVAKKSASQAIKTSRNILLEPMNSYERRIIHNAVQDIEGVSSWSVGENDHRRVCIGTSRDNKPYRPSNNRRGGGYNRDNGGRGGNFNRKPSQRVDAAPTREPHKDSTDLPLYGVINK